MEQDTENEFENEELPGLFSFKVFPIQRTLAIIQFSLEIRDQLVWFPCCPNFIWTSCMKISSTIRIN